MKISLFTRTVKAKKKKKGFEETKKRKEKKTYLGFKCTANNYFPDKVCMSIMFDRQILGREIDIAILTHFRVSTKMTEENGGKIQIST